MLIGARYVWEELRIARGACGSSGEERGGEDAVTYLGDIPPPDCWLWSLRLVHVDADSEVQVLCFRCRSTG